MEFPPVAIVGWGCAFPGGLTPDEFAASILEGRDLVGSVPDGRWRIPVERVLTAEDPAPLERSWTDRGGYVHGFRDRFRPDGFRMPAGDVARHDPLVQWLLHSGRDALRGVEADRGVRARTGVVIGNLSLPSDSLTAYAERVWLGLEGPGPAWADPGTIPPAHPIDRFMSGLPATLVADALGLGGETLALDAACASSLYALDIACGRLHDGTADLMLAGAVNRADDLFLHVGFTTLQALSRSGNSRPFHRGADGLLPAEGAALVALKRLDDAVRDGDPVLGVIRGIGLSNDGRSAGLMVPDGEGQVRALESAYRRSGVEPADISLLECHATGTPVGDGQEVLSLAALYDGLRDVPIGSVKSNVGHPITAAGMAGLIKVLGAMRAGVRPPTLHADDPIDVLADSPFRLLRSAERWEAEDGPRRAGISAFGFGGCNAHLIVEEHRAGAARPAAPRRAPREAGAEAAADPIAVVGLAVRTADGGTDAFARRLLGDGQAAERVMTELALPLRSLSFPPADLREAVPQQVAILACARELLDATPPLPRERTAVLIGMGCEPDIARFGARARMAEWAGRIAERPDPEWVERARDAIQTPLTPARVLGSLANILANRINRQFDLGGPGFAVSAEERSGTAALRLAARSLRAGRIDAAVVGAVDLSASDIHGQAIAACRPEAAEPGDAAVLLVLRRLADARAAGDRVLATLETRDADDAVAGLVIGTTAEGESLGGRFGHVHAAAGLLDVAAGILAVAGRARLNADGVASPWLAAGERSVLVRVRDLAGRRDAVRVAEAADPGGGVPPGPPVGPSGLRLHRYAADSRVELAERVEADRPSDRGAVRLAFLAAGVAERTDRRDRALSFLRGSDPEPGPDLHYGEDPVGGKVAAVFTGAAAAYAGMGRELLLALPSLHEAVAHRFRSIDEAAGWIYRDAEPSPLDRLWGSSLLSQVHAELTLRLCGLEPEAALGISSGETNALFAFGAWRDLDGFHRTFNESGAFDRHLGGRYQVLDGREPGRGGWSAWRVLASPQRIEAALAADPDLRVTIRNGPDDVVLAGPDAACRRAVESIGAGRCIPLGYDIVAHCPELAPYAGAWRALHHRPTSPVDGVDFYSHGAGGRYALSADAVADALTAQALDTVDFPALVRAAWDDGVRVFIEHGPQASCTDAIGRILDGREHLAVALDRKGGDGLEQALSTLARLFAAGVPLTLDRLEGAFGDVRTEGDDPGPLLRLPAHPPRVELPPLEGAPAPATNGDGLSRQWMEPAPTLPPPGYAPVPATVVAPAPVAAPGPAPASTSGASHPLIARQLELQHRYLELLRSRSEAHRRYLHRLLGGGAAPADTGAAPAAPAGWQAGSGLAATPRVSIPVPAQPAPAPPPPPEAPAPATSTPDPAAAPAVESGNGEADAGSPEGPRDYPGPSYDREDLYRLATGRISEVLGPEFAGQDDYPRQVRMPAPPLLLADRVLGIDAEPLSMGTGTIWTETDVDRDAWYLQDGRMPAGLMVEAGQADLLLVSWLGIDMLNRGERVYRLLGCEMTFHGPLARPGETLHFDIHLDSHARQGDIGLFFFHSDCRVDGERRLSVRRGQAGFFTDEELAGSHGVLWKPADTAPGPDEVLEPPPVQTDRRHFDAAAIRAFADGRVYECFGAGFERTRVHVRTPRIPDGDMMLLGDAVELDPAGGPWGRGHLRATRPLHPDDWFFPGHFVGDPCMPGTLMLEGCIQALAFYLASAGYGVDRDGWRFEPVPGETFDMRCRGQAIPSSSELVYEVHVAEITSEPVPTIRADVLGIVDGLKAFYCRRLAVRLVPDWPATSRPEIMAASDDADAATLGGFRFDRRAMLHAAWGRPSDAFGPAYAPFDGVRRLPRLPGPPYLFMSRVVRTDGPFGALEPGTAIEVEYDIEPDAWYFREPGAGTMPFCALLEAALQPCGWLSTYVGVPLHAAEDVRFRNLDGTGTVLDVIRPEDRTLRTRARITNISRSGDVYIESFEVECEVDGRPLYRMSTVFGHFTAEALKPAGLPPSQEERARLQAPSDYALELRDACIAAAGTDFTAPADGGPDAARFFTGGLRLPGPRLLVLDRITGFWPDAGAAGLGRLRAEKTIRGDEWFFRSHFYQDPVQPGSLGIEAMVQLLQFHMLERGMGDGLEDPCFEPLAVHRPVTWKYRGQVMPESDTVVVELEVTGRGEDERGHWASAEAWLWVDGKRVYHATDLGMRIAPRAIAGATHRGAIPRRETPGRAAGDGKADAAPAADSVRIRTLDPERDPWIGDHRPTYALPALPLAAAVDQLATAAGQGQPGHVVAMREVRMHRWVPVPPGGVRLRTAVDARDAELTRVVLQAEWDPDGGFQAAASAIVELAPAYPEPPEPFEPVDGDPEPDPYRSGVLFHGPAFQVLRELTIGTAGSSAWIDLDRGRVPYDTLSITLLDAVAHAMPQDALWRWSDRIPRDRIGFPSRIPELAVYGPPPEHGAVRCEVRFRGFDDDGTSPLFHAQLIQDGTVRIALDVVYALFPRGRLGARSPLDRRRFLRDRAYVPGVSISAADGAATRLEVPDIALLDWLPGTLAEIYGSDAASTADLAREIAAKEHLARGLEVHPSAIDTDGSGGWLRTRPLRRQPLRITVDGSAIQVEDAGPAHLDADRVLDFWRTHLGGDQPLASDIFLALSELFVEDILLEDPAAFDALRGRPALYLANHQVGIESALFCVLGSGLGETPIAALAKTEHRSTWLGRLVLYSSNVVAHPGESPDADADAGLIVFFDREEQGSLLHILQSLRTDLAGGARSLLVHVEGTRSLTCRDPVRNLSAAFLDTALHAGLPIVPVRFVGGLPVEPASRRLEFPVGYGRQQYWIGRPIEPAGLASLPFVERKRLVLDRINGLGVTPADESPAAPRPALEERVHALMGVGLDEPRAVILDALSRLESTTPQTAAVLRAVSGLVQGAADAVDTLDDPALRAFASWLATPDT